MERQIVTHHFDLLINPNCTHDRVYQHSKFIRFSYNNPSDLPRQIPLIGGNIGNIQRHSHSDLGYVSCCALYLCLILSAGSIPNQKLSGNMVPRRSRRWHLGTGLHYRRDCLLLMTIWRDGSIRVESDDRRLSIERQTFHFPNNL